MQKEFYKYEEVTKEIIERSIVLFREYHGLYEDDYEGLLWYDPITNKFGAEYWTTAAACGVCRKYSDFGYQIEDLIVKNEHLDWVEDIKNILRESISSDESRDKYFKNKTFERFLEWNHYNKYSYQKKAAEAVTNELYERWKELWQTVDNFYILLYYTPEATSHSYKNDKESIEWHLEKIPYSIPGMFLGKLDNKLVPKRKRAVKFEGERFVGEVISRKTKFVTYGYRSDWHNVVTFGIKCEGLEKTVWFKLSESYLTDSITKGMQIEVFGKVKGEFEHSIQINYVKIKSINNFKTLKKL